MSSELRATAGVFATAVADAVAEKDRPDVLRVLKAIGRVPGLSFASVEDAGGGVIAEIGAGVRLVGGQTVRDTVDRVELLRGHPVEMRVPVIKGGVRIGSLLLVTYPIDLWPRIWTGIRDILTWAAVAGILGLLAAARLSRGITGPIGALADTMSGVSSKQDFSRIVERGSVPELALLTDAFNDMMSNIRERDARLARHRDRLEDDIAERTRDLQVAKDEAEAANAAKSDFLATMSHEIRTPMNGMLVMAELLTKAELSENLRRYAEVISSSGHSLMTIINDILDLSKIEAGKLDLEKTEMRLTDTVRDVLTLFQERAAEKHLDLTGFIAADVKDAIVADPVRLRQVLGNLVSNAIKFTEQGHVAVTVDLVESWPTGDSQNLKISVEDTGVGIPQDKVAAVFEAFSQADQSTTRKFGGTGLGLAICRKLVEAFNGRIHVESTLGKGSKFSVELVVDVAAKQPLLGVPAGLSRARAVVAIEGGLSRLSLKNTLEALGFERVAIMEDRADPPVPGEVLFAELQTIRTMDKTPFADRPDGPFYVAVSRVGAEGADEACGRGDADAIVYRPVLAPDLIDALVMLTPEGRRALRPRQSPGRAVNETLRWPKAKVLVADDSPVNQEVAREALARFGIVPDIVENGAEAVRAASHNAYDLILMDCSMPVMDGYEASRRIRGRQGRHVSIVALTAQVMEEASFKRQSSGMDAMLAKPFTLDQLRACLADHLTEGVAGPADETPTGRDAEAAATSDPISKGPVAAVETGSNGQSGHTGSPPVVLNTDHLHALAGGTGPEASALLGRILSLFEKHAPDAVKTIGMLAANGETGALADAVHALKSMSANIGAERLAALCGNMEQAANAGLRPDNLEDLDRLYGETLESITMFKMITDPGSKSGSGGTW